MTRSGCLSCDVVAGRRDVPGGTIYEDEYWWVGSAASPVVWRGFLIVALKRHCEHLAELSAEEAAALGPLIQTACRALSEVLRPAKVYVCSFGDGVKHIHVWILPRPPEMRPGMHWVFLHLDLRMLMTRLGFKRWICDETSGDLAIRVREHLTRPLPPGREKDGTETGH